MHLRASIGAEGSGWAGEEKVMRKKKSQIRDLPPFPPLLGALLEPSNIKDIAYFFTPNFSEFYSISLIFLTDTRTQQTTQCDSHIPF